MKSAYELAMERMGEDDVPLTEDQKRKISDIETKYKAKIAERKSLLEKKSSRRRSQVIGKKRKKLGKFWPKKL